MKKALSFLLALCLLMSFVSIAFAAGEYPTSIEYTIESNNQLSFKIVLQSIMGIDIGFADLYVTGMNEDSFVSIECTGNTVISEEFYGESSFHHNSFVNGDQVVVKVTKGSARVSCTVANGGIYEIKNESIRPMFTLGKDTYSFQNYFDEDSDIGHCFGMSITCSAYFLGMLDPAKVGATDGIINNLKQNEYVEDPICFYQKIQGSSASGLCIVAGKKPSAPDTGNIDANWDEVINYVSNHEYDHTGELEISIGSGSAYHSVNFLYYAYEDGEDRIYIYDSNYPDKKTYYYKNSDGLIKQAPVETFIGKPITSIRLLDVPTYLRCTKWENIPEYLVHIIFARKGSIWIDGSTVWPISSDSFGDEYVVYEIDSNLDSVEIIPSEENVSFTYLDKKYSITNSDGETSIIFQLSDNADSNNAFISEIKTNHEYKEKVTPSTCTTSGIIEMICSNCGDIEFTQVIPAIGHNFTTEERPATCTSLGEKRIICSACGETYTTSIPETGHSDSNGDGYCDVCGMQLGESQNNCTHMCHKSGFIDFFWKIVNLFNKLFKLNQYCSCGAKHW